MGIKERAAGNSVSDKDAASTKVETAVEKTPEELREERQKERDARRRDENRDDRRDRNRDENRRDRDRDDRRDEERQKERERREREREEKRDREQARTEEQDKGTRTMKSVRFANAFQSGRNTERVNKFMGLFKQWKDDHEGDHQFQVQNKHIRTYPVPGMEALGPVSLLMTIGEFPGDDKVYYSLILVENRENTVREMTRRSNDRRRDREEVREYISLAEQLDDKTLTAVEEAICSQITVEPEQMKYCGFVVLNYGVSLETVDAIMPILGTSTDYVMSTAGMTQEIMDRDLKDDGIKLEGILGIVGTQDVTGYSGQPIRNDISISLETSVTGNNRSTSLIDNSSQAQWATASAYVDLIPVECPGDDRYERSKDHQISCLQPRLIYSEVDVYREEYCKGPMVRSMIAVAIGVDLDKSSRYMKAFMPTAFSSRDRKLSSLGYLMDPSGPVAPQALDIENPDDDQCVFENLKRLIRESRGMEFVYRFNEGQAGSAFGELLRDIAEDRSSTPRDFLFDLLDDATGNRFSDEFDNLKGRDVIATSINLPDGTYMTNHGAQPVTRLDHWFAAEKFTDRDIDRLEDYIEVHSFNSSLNNDERVAKAVDLYKHLSGDTFKMTGIVTLLMFDPIFLEACYKAFRGSAMELQVNRDRDEIRGRRGDRNSTSYGLRYDSIRNADRGRSGSRRDDRRERTRGARW